MVATIFARQSPHQPYLAEAMQRVSRSFALVIPWLEEPLQTYLASSYLLCRKRSALPNLSPC